MYAGDAEYQGRSDVFSLGVAAYQIFEGVLPTPTSVKLREAYRAWNQAANKRTREVEYEAMKKTAREYFNDRFRPAVSGGGNVAAIHRSDAHLIAEMCCVDKRFRPTASGCLELLRKLKTIDSDASRRITLKRETVHMVHYEHTNVCSLSPVCPLTISMQPPAAVHLASVCLEQVVKEYVVFEAVIEPLSLDVASPVATKPGILTQAIAASNFFNLLSPPTVPSKPDMVTMQDTIRKLSQLATELVCKAGAKHRKVDTFEGVTNIENECLLRLRKSKSSGIGKYCLYLLQVLFTDTSYASCRFAVFSLLTQRTQNWWDKSKEVRRLRGSSSKK